MNYNELQQLKEKALKDVDFRRGKDTGVNYKYDIMVCGGTGCRSCKSKKVQEALEETIKQKGLENEMVVHGVGCFGLCVNGPIVLVYPQDALYEKVSVDEVRKQFDVNVFGHIEMTQGLIELLNDGKIINISSMSSFGIFPFISPYCASKRCLDMFFNSLLIENKRNLKIVSIKPGVISTPLWDKSVKENSKLIDNCEGYEEEMNFISRNALKNETKGLSVDKVVDLILKIDSMKNPKLSYLVGKDAVFASLLSKLPQGMVNKIVKFGLKARMDRV